MSPQSATPTYTFATSAALALEATFDGGRLTSDGGLPWLAEAEESIGICRALAACVAGMAARPHRPLHRGVDAPARLWHRLRLRGPERCRHPARRPAAQAGLRPTTRERRRPSQPAAPLALRERGGPPRLPGLGPCPARRVPAGAGARRPPHAPRPGHRQHRRPHARGAGGHRLPRLLSPAHVPPPARLRRRDRPTHRRPVAPRQHARQPRRD